MLLKLINFGFAENQDKEQAAFEPVKPVVVEDQKVTGDEEAGRRQMYERIARGNALIEVEENARRVWRGNR